MISDKPVSEGAITALRPSIVKTIPGKLIMPTVVTATLRDGSSRFIPVVWNRVDPSLYADINCDGFEVQGRVSGTDAVALARVLVLPPNREGIMPIVVSADGHGDFPTVRQALESISLQNLERRVIFIKHGTYREKLLIDRPYVTIEGQDADGTVLSYDDKPTDRGPDGKPLGTYGDYAVKVTGDDCIIRNLTIQTLAGPKVGPAVALEVHADHVRIDHCHILGYQDTLLLQNKADESVSDNPPDQPTLQTNRVYISNSLIRGSVDFIFGSAIAIFDHCDIQSALSGYVTAASTPEDQEYGFVFTHCRMRAEQGDGGPLTAYLGRPWRSHASVAYIDTDMAGHIPPAGWDDWEKESNRSTARFSEYGSTGEGGVLADRVPWAKKLTRDEADAYTMSDIFARQSGINTADNWDPTRIAMPAPSPPVPVTIEGQGSTDQGIIFQGNLRSYAHSDDGKNLSFKTISQPRHGLLILAEDGAFSYRPQPGYGGVDQFTFQAFNGSQSSNTSTFTITVGVESDDQEGRT